MPVAFTPAAVDEALYNVSLQLKDTVNETIQKVTKLFNAGNSIVQALQYYDDLTGPAVSKASISASHVVAGWKASATGTGQFPKVGDVMILVFSRTHPTDATRTIFNEFLLAGPIPATYEISAAGARPIPDQEADFSTATPTAVQKLGALVNWLETALTVKVGQTTYAGDWEYVPTRSVCGSLPKRYDGIPLT